MNLDNLNKWLTLIANVGVLVGIFVVAVELRQTQTEMRAESATMRAQMAIQNGDSRARNRTFEINQKIATGQELTDDEETRARNYQQTLLRYFENIHYQFDLGVLDEEIWQANLNGISRLCSDRMFNYLYPELREGGGMQTYRASFIDLIVGSCGQ